MCVNSKRLRLSLAVIFSFVLSSISFADDHLENSKKFIGGERYKNCVYGPGGTIEYTQIYTNPETGEKDTNEAFIECGSGWEGRGLWQTFITSRDGEHLWDLQRAYNCCITSDDPRNGVCNTVEHTDAANVSWDACTTYVGTLMGNVPSALPPVRQRHANEAVKMACMAVLGGDAEMHVERDREKYEEFLTNPEYHGRFDLMYQVCFKDIGRLVPVVFDYLRDQTPCLWNKPDEDFCGGSRRAFPGTREQEAWGWSKSQWPDKYADFDGI
jgi:hypothetical protein